jgi:hypothetical protein
MFFSFNYACSSWLAWSWSSPACWVQSLWQPQREHAARHHPDITGAAVTEGHLANAQATAESFTGNWEAISDSPNNAIPTHCTLASLRPPEVRDEKGHHLRARDRRLCGSLLNPPNPLPISNIKIVPPEVLYSEEFYATWPYRETSFEGKISGSAEDLTVSHRQLPEV